MTDAIPAKLGYTSYAMTAQTRERRSRQRLPVSLGVKVKKPDGTEQEGTTRDLSSSGIFLYAPPGMEAGAKLELVVMVPPSLGLGPGGWALCQASVVRVEQTAGKGVGVAAVFDRIELLPEIS